MPRGHAGARDRQARADITRPATMDTLLLVIMLISRRALVRLRGALHRAQRPDGGQARGPHQGGEDGEPRAARLSTLVLAMELMGLPMLLLGCCGPFFIVLPIADVCSGRRRPGAADGSARSLSGDIRGDNCRALPARKEDNHADPGPDQGRPCRATQLRPRPQRARGDQARQQRGALRPPARCRRGAHRGGHRACTATPTWAWQRCATSWPTGWAWHPDRVVTGCGSVALAEHLARTTCMPGDNIVYSWRSFEAYPIIAATTAAESVKVPNTAGTRPRPSRDEQGDHRPHPA